MEIRLRENKAMYIVAVCVATSSLVGGFMNHATNLASFLIKKSMHDARSRLECKPTSLRESL